MKHFLIFPLLFSFFSGVGQTKFENIDSLLTISKFDNTVNTVYNLVKNGYPSITAEAWEEILGENDEVVKTIRNEVINQFANELTLEDINELLKFYNSPIGKKLLKTNEIAAVNLQTWGEKWGAKKAEDFFEYVKK